MMRDSISTERGVQKANSLLLGCATSSSFLNSKNPMISGLIDWLIGLGATNSTFRLSPLIAQSFQESKLDSRLICKKRFSNGAGGWL